MEECERTRLQMVAAVRGELEDPATGALERHVASCAACSTQWEEIRRAWAALGHLANVAPAPSLREAVLQHLCGRDPPTEVRLVKGRRTP